MKVLIISDYGVPRGGNEIVTLALRDGLRQRGHDVRLFASNAFTNREASQADYHCFGTKSPLRAVLWPGNPSAYFRLHRVLADFQPDVVHMRLFLSQLSPVILPLLEGIPSVYHDGWYRTVCPIGSNVLPDGRECNESAGKVCYRNGCVPLLAWPLVMTQLQLWRRWRGVFKVVIANSQAVARHLEASGISNVEVIPNGIVAPEPSKPLAEPPTLAFAGRLTFEKGVDVMLDAFKQVMEQMPQARLLIAGEGPESHRVRSAVRHFSDNIEFPGYLPRKKLEKFFEGAWVKVVPSRGAEAFGNTAAEAMMRGTAVVASASGGFTEYVRHDHTGLLVPPNDPEALAAMLLRALSDRKFAEELGQAGRRFALKQFDFGIFLDRIEAIYKSISA